MAAIRTARLALFICALCASAAAAAANVGFREIHETDGGGEFGLWYPSDAPPAPLQLGPFNVRYAADAPPAAGSFSVVVMSHGYGGRYHNHHLTAAHLAANGFIVVAPQHRNDAWFAAGRTRAMHARIGELGAALDALAALPEFRAVANMNDVSAVGYSLGGATVVAAAGAEFDFSAAARHCKLRHEQDAYFCSALPWWARLWHTLLSAIFPRGGGDIEPLAFRKVALAAPVGQLFKAEDLADFRPDALILRFARDEHLRYPFHAEYLRAHMPARAQLEVVDAHHYAFIAPVPERLRDNPSAFDPPDFDRAAFLERVNRRVLDFLRE
ncbi:MAG: dienelactone hydrolase family protein [Gammaproteobacteria bacterium]|nr:dienelactone hydrolase family protein [Gammaproteobacteria bacterium]